jgi:hypothetical protein
MSNSNNFQYVFPVGFHQFHKKQIYNFQLSRYYSLGFARYEDMEEAGDSSPTAREIKDDYIAISE